MKREQFRLGKRHDEALATVKHRRKLLGLKLPTGFPFPGVLMAEAREHDEAIWWALQG
jgi:hypothetical protein